MRALPLLALLLLGTASAQDARPEADARRDFVVAVQTPDGEPIVGATVRVGDRGASTDADGEATVAGLAPGRYRVRVSFIGWQTRELAARLDAPGPWGLIVEMVPDEVALGEVVVEARDLGQSRLAADGFFDRFEAGFGTVLTREDIERKNPIRLGDALSGVIGVRVRTRSFRQIGDTPGRTATSVYRGDVCEMAVYLDGMYSPSLTSDIDAISAQDVVAIEVYRGPSEVPMLYNHLGRGGGCGVVLVWTSRSLAQPQ